jgi:peroxiredoxin
MTIMLSTRNVALGLVSVLLMAGLAHGQPEPEAKAKLDKMAEAVRAAKSISFKVEFHGQGGFMAMLPSTELTVLLAHELDEPAKWSTRYMGRRAEVAGAGGVPAVNIRMVSDGTKTTWVDDGDKKVFERFSGSATGDTVTTVALAGLREITDADPFGKDRSAPIIKAEGTATADGVACEVVFADQGAGQAQSRWTIGPDNLPRKLERILAGVGTQIWTVTEMKVNPVVPEGSFAISTPDGYSLSPAVAYQSPPIATPTTTIGSDGTTTTPAAPAAPRQRAIGSNTGDLAPDFELSTPAGEKVRLSALKGTVVVLDFWGTWCLPCKKASPELQKLTDAYKEKGVKVFGLAVRETNNEKPIAYMKDNSYTYGLLLKADEVAKLFRVKVYPSYFVIAKDGEIALMTGGYDDQTFTKITQAVDLALGSGETPPAKGAPSPASPPSPASLDK